VCLRQIAAGGIAALFTVVVLSAPDACALAAGDGATTSGLALDATRAGSD
jgi:hypothetical protein